MENTTISKLISKYGENRVIDVSGAKNQKELASLINKRPHVYILSIDNVPILVGKNPKKETSRSSILLSDKFEISHNKSTLTRLALLDAETGNVKVEKLVVISDAGSVGDLENEIQKYLGFRDQKSNEKKFRELVDKRKAVVQNHVGRDAITKILPNDFLEFFKDAGDAAFGNEILYIKRYIETKKPEWRDPFEVLLGYKSKTGSGISTKGKNRGEMTYQYGRTKNLEPVKSFDKKFPKQSSLGLKDPDTGETINELSLIGILKEVLKKRVVKEDIFLKKDPENKKIVVFSDKEDKRSAAKETISLAKEFRKLGLDWSPSLGHWTGSYDKLAEVNGLIKSHNRIKEVIDSLDAMEDFVASSDADPTAKSTIMDNLETYINDLANATDQSAMDAAIRNYLTFYSKFHNYSFTNSMLIFMQKKDATKVAGYNTWKKQNRGVKKGAKAIWIWFPMTVNSKQETDTAGVDFGAVDQAAKSRSFTKFSLGKVYDISDTYELNEKGKVPEQPKWSADNTPSELADQLVERINEFATGLGINITKTDAKGGEKGFSAGGHINLSSDVEGVGAASTLVHELAHELLHWKEKSPFYMDDADSSSREMKELQAESVSYVVLKHYGLPVTQHPTYLALWKANKEKIMKNLQVIQKCAKYIIDGIDAQGKDEK